MKGRIATIVMVACGVAAACGSKPAETAGAGQAAASHEQTAAPAAGASTATTVQGPVLETMDAGNYTYVRVKTDAGEIWAATLAFKIAVGDTVVVPLENPMQNFHSAALKRDFPLIYFASDITRPGAAPAADAAGLPPGHPATTAATDASAAPAAAPAAEPKLIAPVPPAPGGVSIATVWTDRTKLAGKLVTVRGKVVKYNGGIMGLNWVHLQDGSGSVANGTHDLTITSTTEARVGDIVTITGTVVVDKDFTAGYKYGVMLQGAKIVTK